MAADALYELEMARALLADAIIHQKPEPEIRHLRQLVNLRTEQIEAQIHRELAS